MRLSRNRSLTIDHPKRSFDDISTCRVCNNSYQYNDIEYIAFREMFHVLT